MDHVAIMKKSLGFLPKIISGEKTIESRFYNSKRSPWDKIKTGDRIFFKNTGEKITVTAFVSQVLQNPRDLKQYMQALCLNSIPKKKYAILIFLKDVEKIEPFDINKKGFGSMSAWLSVDNIDKIRMHA